MVDLQVTSLVLVSFLHRGGERILDQRVGCHLHRHEMLAASRFLSVSWTNLRGIVVASDNIWHSANLTCFVTRLSVFIFSTGLDV